MKIFEAYTGMYECRHLPAYARFLIDHQLENFSRELIAAGHRIKIPLLTSLSLRFTEAEILDIAIGSTKEYLQFIATNRAKDQLVTAMERWIQDRLEVVSKLDVIAQDITLINYIRSYAMKKFLPLYTSDLDRAVEVALEIDTLMLGGNTTAVDLYIDLLKEKIAEQSNLATKVIEASPAITFLIDTQSHRQLFISGNITAVLGYSEGEIAQMGDAFLLQLTHPDDVGPLLEHLQQVIADNQNKTRQFEFRFRHKDGSYRWLRTYEVIFKRDAEGKPLEILGKTFEITQEKETALALQTREQQLLEAQSIAHLGSYEWNIRDNWSSNTEEVHRIFGMSKNEHYEEFLSYVHPEDLQKVRESIAHSFETGKYECEYRFVRNGVEKVIWSVGRVEFRGNLPYRMVGTVQDVTEFKKMERELLQKSEQLAQTNESLRQFAYVASHDMKEPLRKIMMFADLVLSTEKTKLSDRSVTQLQKMQSSGKNLYRMIEDILSFSLLEAKENRQRVSLGSIIREVEELLDESIREKQADLKYNDLPEVWVIPSQFRQLFQNLIANSLKFAKKDVPPVITIKAKITATPALAAPVQAEDYLELCVGDNGTGFPEEMSEKVFELFSRYHPKSQYEGTGLGLSISRRIVSNHNGAIKAFSQPNRGATFKIVIPQEREN